MKRGAKVIKSKYFFEESKVNVSVRLNFNSVFLSAVLRIGITDFNIAFTSQFTFEQKEKSPQQRAFSEKTMMKQFYLILFKIFSNIMFSF